MSSNHTTPSGNAFLPATTNELITATANEPLPASNEQSVPQPTKKTWAKCKPKRPKEAQPFIQASALFARSFDMYGKPGDTVEHRWTLVSDDKDTLGSDQDDSNQALYDKKAFEFLLKNSAALVAVVSDGGRDIDQIKQVGRWLNDGSIAARNTDTVKVKEAVQDSFGIRPGQELGVLPFDNRIKVPHLCGYGSDLTGRILTPIGMAWDNPIDRTNLQTAGCIIPTNARFPYQYPKDKFNSADMMENLYRGELCWQTYHTLFSLRAARRSHVLPSVTKHRVAYSIALLHHALTGSHMINTEFNVDMHYVHVYEFLLAPENEEFWKALQVHLHLFVYGLSIRSAPRLPEVELVGQTQTLAMEPTAHKRWLDEVQEQDNQVDHLAIDPQLQNPPLPSEALAGGRFLTTVLPLVTGSVPASAPSPALTIPTSPASALSPLSMPTSPIIPPTEITSEPTTISTQPDQVQPSLTITTAQSDTASAKRQKGNDGKARSNAGGKTSGKNTKVAPASKRTT